MRAVQTYDDNGKRWALGCTCNCHPNACCACLVEGDRKDAAHKLWDGVCKCECHPSKYADSQWGMGRVGLEEYESEPPTPRVGEA